MLRNFTPHSITLIFPTGESITLPSEGVARVSVKEVPATAEDVLFPTGETLNFPVFFPTMGAIEGLPNADGSTFIVSAIVREAARRDKRLDCVSPARLVRDGAGNVVGCTAFHY